MSFTRKTAAFVLLAALDAAPARNVTAQVAHGALPKLASDTNAIAHIPRLGGINYDAKLFVHVPPSKKLRLFSNGDATGELQVSDNLMRYDVSFANGRATNTIWSNLDKDISIEVRHGPFQDASPSMVESFFANLDKLPVTKIGERPYPGDVTIDGKIVKNPMVTDYYVDHQMINDSHAYVGLVSMLKYQGGQVPLLMDGSEKKVDDTDCGKYEHFVSKIVSLETAKPSLKDMLPPPPPYRHAALRVHTQACTVAP